MRTPTSATGRLHRLPAGIPAGFTLLELILAVSIAALVVGASAPAMQQLYASSQYRGAVNDVLSSLSMTRQEAIRSGVAVDVGFNPVERRIVRGSKTIELPDSLEMEVLAARELNRGDLGVIRFYPDGGASGGHVRLTHERGMSTQLTVDWLLGTVALCQSDCPDAL